MKKILHIISSPRGEASYSIKLGKAIIEKLLIAYPGSTLKEVNLVTTHFPHLEESHLMSFFTPPENRNEALQIAVKHSDQAIKDLKEADIVIIGAPMYNFNIHSALKAWVDHIVRSGITFNYSDAGAEGLLKNKKVYIAESTGGIYSEGPMKSNDFIAPYLKTVLSFIGLSDITIFRIEGTAIPGHQDSAVEKGLNSIIIV